MEVPFDCGLIEFGARVEALDHNPASPLSGYDETAVSLATGINRDINVSRSERHPDTAELYSVQRRDLRDLSEIP